MREWSAHILYSRMRVWYAMRCDSSPSTVRYRQRSREYNLTQPLPLLPRTFSIQIDYLPLI